MRYETKKAQIHRKSADLKTSPVQFECQDAERSVGWFIQGKEAYFRSDLYVTTRLLTVHVRDDKFQIQLMSSLQS